MVCRSGRSDLAKKLAAASGIRLAARRWHRVKRHRNGRKATSVARRMRTGGQKALILVTIAGPRPEHIHVVTTANAIAFATSYTVEQPRPSRFAKLVVTT